MLLPKKSFKAKTLLDEHHKNFLSLFLYNHTNGDWSCIDCHCRATVRYDKLKQINRDSLDKDLIRPRMQKELR